MRTASAAQDARALIQVNRKPEAEAARRSN
jgi:hypothetical protein